MYNGTVIEGEYFNNKPHGKCQISYNNGSKYQGGMAEGLKSGYGELEDVNENILYKGHWLEDKKHGEGYLHYFEKGFIYDG